MDNRKRNYQLELDQMLQKITDAGSVPRLLLHACCAPCSSYVLEYLTKYFSITVRFYNPNIGEREEYVHRAEELKRLIREMPAAHPVTFTEGAYEPEAFEKMAEGLENVQEGGERCFRCYRMRLAESAAYAAANGFDYFTTTLSISPLKNAQKLNEIGAALSEEFGVPYLFSDFKKKDGYKRSIELSEVYGLYRQNYCGCRFSKR
ncbi:MAG: epoxyqueuosine reductase QueH [Lachnospiraceae bacterium]|nr:epoxyqueuosine reductase QueH [Lachnospiraceae bacterium]